MLEKLLPFLNRAQRQSPVVSPPSSSIGELSDNLITPDNIPLKILNSYFYFSVSILVTFIVLVVINTAFRIYFNSQKIVQTNLLSNLDNVEDQRKKIVSVDKKISFYKNSLSSRKTLSEKTHFVLDRIMEGLVATDAEVTNEKFQVTLVGNNVYLFTQLILSYLQGGGISEISISSATYNPGDQKFKVELSGVFK